MKSPELVLQEAQIEQLKAVLTCPVYDAVPDDAPFPFVSLGETTSLDRSAKGEPVLAVTSTIHIYSRDAGMKEVKEILDLVLPALSKRRPSLGPDFRIIADRLDGISNLRDDETTRHTVVSWWYLIEELGNG
jgi:hypothetical protein